MQSIGRIIFFLLIFIPIVNAFDIIAHRGDTHYAPENTLAAVNAAWKNGADAVEIDVHLSKDGKIVVIHDFNTIRTTGQLSFIKELTGEEIKKLDAGSWKSRVWKDEKIPFLTQVLSTIKPGKKVYIDIKSGVDIIPKLKQIIYQNKIKSQEVFFLSHSISLLKKLKSSLPNFNMNVTDIVFYYNFLQNWQNTSLLVDKVDKAGLNGLSLNFLGKREGEKFKEMLIRLHKQAKQHHLKLYAWTINNPEVAKKLMAAKFNGIITDDFINMQKLINNRK